jgi:hypothetical protein
MERCSTLNHTPASASSTPAMEAGVELKIAELDREQEVQQNSANQSAKDIASSHAVTLAGAGATPDLSRRFTAEGGGHSVADMAQRDLDAALQLLADRAQYITGASGAAIALRRNGKNDMLCRASTGSNAPELGALLSTEFGLSGESVRTRKALRCDDAERDARVNREVCRQLGIASVVVMPVVNDDEVLGVFELFSGKANAFGERDLSAVQRLSEMVETAVKVALAAQMLPQQPVAQEIVEAKVAVTETVEEQILEGDIIGGVVLEEQASKADEPPLEVVAETTLPESAEAPAVPVNAAAPQTAEAQATATPAPVTDVAPPKKTLYWTAAQSSNPDAAKAAEGDQSNIPPVLRSLQKCVACGFPVSAGRMLCVECEEKKWKGQLRSARAAAAGQAASATSVTSGRKAEGRTLAAAAAQSSTAGSVPSVQVVSATGAASTGNAQPSTAGPKAESAGVASPALPAVPAPAVMGGETAPRPAQTSQASSPELVLSAGLEPSQSWLSANKYIVAMLLVAAGAAAVVFFLR